VQQKKRGLARAQAVARSDADAVGVDVLQREPVEQWCARRCERGVRETTAGLLRPSVSRRAGVSAPRDRVHAPRRVAGPAAAVGAARRSRCRAAGKRRGGGAAARQGGVVAARTKGRGTGPCRHARRRPRHVVGSEAAPHAVRAAHADRARLRDVADAARRRGDRNERSEHEGDTRNPDRTLHWRNAMHEAASIASAPTRPLDSGPGA
jgi:hypothetical protein